MTKITFKGNTSFVVIYYRDPQRTNVLCLPSYSCNFLFQCRSTVDPPCEGRCWSLVLMRFHPFPWIWCPCYLHSFPLKRDFSCWDSLNVNETQFFKAQFRNSFPIVYLDFFHFAYVLFEGIGIYESRFLLLVFFFWYSVLLCIPGKPGIDQAGL